MASGYAIGHFLALSGNVEQAAVAVPRDLVPPIDRFLVRLDGDVDEVSQPVVVVKLKRLAQAVALLIPDTATACLSEVIILPPIMEACGINK